MRFSIGEAGGGAFLMSFDTAGSAGDTAGFPITIDGSAGRSYRLTGDLVVPNENTDGIVVDASDIGIDLNNFAIIAAACVGAMTNCTPTSGTGSGIERSSTAIRSTSVRDGSIIGMGNFGVLVGDQSEVRSERARWNRVVGIAAGSGSTISGNTARLNTGFGLDLGFQSGHRENVIANNTAGTVNGATALNLGNNACNGSATCP